MTGKIIGTGSCVPEHFMDNNDLAEIVETNDEWIRERTGIVRRHISKEETTVQMAAEAANRAIQDAGIDPEEIELILVSTISSNVVLPCAACEVQRLTGAVNATCFDLNAACTGFVFAYNTAQAYIAAGICRTALIIGAENLSKLVDWTDRGTCILFGDGAGAAVLGAASGEGGQCRGAGGGILTVTHSQGSKGEALTCETGSFMKMDGQAVFKFAVKRVPEVIRELLGQQGIRMEEIDYFVLHQANRRIVEAVAKRLSVPLEKFPMNLQEYGNTSSASIPILLDEMKREGKLKEGQKIVMAGFGAGLSWGASLMEW